MGSAPRRLLLLLLSLALIVMVAPSAANAAAPPAGNATAYRLVTGLEGGAGSTVGPDGALYVAETAAGRITRVDPRTGATTTYASGLPRSIIGLGGAMDFASSVGPRTCWSPW
jgi:streptogramin lyase